MRDSLEGLDPTAEAETSMRELDLEESQGEARRGPSAKEPDANTLRRALRDLEAAKARVERDAQRQADDLREKLVLELLPVLDNFDRTIRAAEANGASPPLLQGIRLVRSQFANTLAKLGVERIDAKHQPFDPRLHDAISVVPVHHPSGHDVVVDVIEPGYRFGQRLLRPARVIVGKHAPRYH